MQPLDKNKRYSLANCSDAQLKEILQWLKKNDWGWEKTVIYTYHSLVYKGEWKKEITLPTDICATTLFNQPKDSIVEAVINKMATRSETGIKKYGTTLDRKDLTPIEWMRHFQEECMDAALYAERWIRDMEGLTNQKSE